MRQLVINSIGHDFDPKTHVALGPWCFHHAENVFPEWEDLAFVDPFRHAADRYSADVATRALANRLLDGLWPRLNARHGTAHDRVFWHSVAMYWICHVVQLGWRVYENVRCFVDRHEEEPFEVALTALNGRFRFAGMEDFLDACFVASDFRNWLVSEIVCRLAPPNWVMRVERAVTPAPVSSVAPVRRHRRSFERIPGISRLEPLFSFYVDMLPRKPAVSRSVREENVPDFPPKFLALAPALRRCMKRRHVSNTAQERCALSPSRPGMIKKI